MTAARALAGALALATLLGVASAAAHEVRPAFLELREEAEGRVEVLFKVPMRGDLALALAPVLPADCRPLAPARAERVPGARVTRQRLDCPEGLDGGTLAVDGLATTLTDVLVRIERAGGAVQVARLEPTSPPLVIEARARPLQVAVTYGGLGVEHILLGIDHLLFVAALLLLIRSRGRLLATITAFTLAHSATLALATLGVVHVPGPPVEAAIALSIVFVAGEIVHARRGHPGIAERAPWLVAGGFGLLHGLGFAGALAEVGLPETAIPMALLAFNLGVEVGQVAFVAAVLALRAAGRALVPATAVPGAAIPGALADLPAYAIGSVAAFWTLERVAGFFA